MASVQSDTDLVLLAQGGSHRAFEVLVDRYWRSAVSMAWQRTRHQADAEDAAQDAFILAWRKLTQLRDPERFAGWFFTIVSRSCVEVARRKPRRPMPVEDPEPMTEPVLDPLERRGDRATVRSQIQEAISHLPERYRAVVVLRYGQGMSVAGIGRTLDLPRGTVVSQIFRANRILRGKLQHLVGER
jgi:RNA polymerase sigma-70 factor (ECF subfamily)